MNATMMDASAKPARLKEQAVEKPKTRFVFGEIQGNIPLSDRVKKKASEFCEAHFAAEKAIDFCGESVETFMTPAWVPSRSLWLPAAELRDMGFAEAPREATREPADQMIVTLGVDPHEDAHGPVLCMVLHNDGLKFKQGKVAHIPKAGDWFVFNDLLPHGVKEAPGRAVFASINVPLVRID